MKTTYDYNPHTDPKIAGLSQKGKENIVGVETPMWTEFAWAESASKDWIGFKQRIKSFLNLLKRFDIEYADTSLFKEENSIVKKITVLIRFYFESQLGR